MAERLSAHLSGLSASALDRLAKVVLPSVPASRGLAERAVAQHLADPLWIQRILTKLGPRAQAALQTLARAGVPVARGDAAALSSGVDADPLEQLEAHGLVTAVKTGPGMPTHVAVTPGLEELVRARADDGASPVQAAGASRAAAQRRFELAVLLAATVQAAPRLTREGRLHAADLPSLSTRLGATTGAPALERRLLRLVEEGALHGASGRLGTTWTALQSVTELHLRMALADLAAPSVPEGSLGIISQLAEPDATMPLRTALDAVRVTLLRDRADGEETPRRGARRELAETLGALFSLTGVLLLDAAGQPVTGVEGALLERVAAGESLLLALDPAVGAVLRGEPAPAPAFARGHVQSSFEVVADASCDPSLVACVGAWGRLGQADRAAVFQLDRRSANAAARAGFQPDALVEAMTRLTGLPPPPNVERHVRDWHAAGTLDPRVPPYAPTTPIEALRDAALAALRSAAPVG